MISLSLASHPAKLRNQTGKIPIDKLLGCRQVWKAMHTVNLPVIPLFDNFL